MKRLTETDIVYERGDFWVACEGPGLFRVYESGATHSTRVGTFHFAADPGKARARATADADRRDSLKDARVRAVAVPVGQSAAGHDLYEVRACGVKSYIGLRWNIYSADASRARKLVTLDGQIAIRFYPEDQFCSLGTRGEGFA